MSGVQRIALRQISVSGGDVLHGLKADDPGFAGFGEAYFTTVDFGAVKGWKRHRAMTMNLIVPVGRVRFAIGSTQEGGWRLVTHDLSADDPAEYARLVVPPGYWMAFAGMGTGLNRILNIASIAHDPAEADNAPLETFGLDWATQAS